MHTKNPQSPQKVSDQKAPRGGLGNKGDPLAIKYSINEAIKDIQRTSYDIEKTKKNKEELLDDLADLRIREKEAVENDLSEEAHTLIKKNILNLQKKLAELNGIIPDVELSDDQKKIQKIINEWNEGKKEKKRARVDLIEAEVLLAKDPSNMRAMGQANRARATMYASSQEMEKAFSEAQVVKKNFTRDPVLDESVNIHTGEEEMKEEPVTKKTTSSPEQGTHMDAPSLRADEKREVKDNEPAKEHDPVRDEGVSYTHKQLVIDQEKYHATQKPVKKDAEVVEKITIQDSKSNVPFQKEEHYYTEATKNLLLQMNRVLAKNKVVASAPQKKEEVPVFTLKPAENRLLLNEGEHIPRSRFTSLKKAVQGSFIRPAVDKSPDSRLGRKLKKNQAPSLVERTLSHHMDILFGKRGFLGIGARTGIASPHWKDSRDGFAKKTIEDIFVARLPAQAGQETPKENASHYVGIKNYEATTKMKKYLSQAFEQTKINPNPKEIVQDYLLRAITTIFDNYKQ